MLQKKAAAAIVAEKYVKIFKLLEIKELSNKQMTCFSGMNSNWIKNANLHQAYWIKVNQNAYIHASWGFPLMKIKNALVDKGTVHISIA